MIISRRRLLQASLAAPALISSRAYAGNAGGVRVGAIRWDAWYNSTAGSSGYYASGNLGPSYYQSRAPFFATQTSSVAMAINGNTQSVFDQEITYAANAGIKFWAYNWYSSGNSLLNGWLLHQSSSIKNNVNWCILDYYAQFHTDMVSLAATYAGYFQQSNYEKAISARPLLFLLRDATPAATIATDLATLRAACTTAGVSAPYVVIMDQSNYAADKTTIGADAVSCYAYNPGGLLQTYTTLDTATQAFWATQKTNASTVLPIGMTGFDRRPRIEHPVPWEVPGQRAKQGMNAYFATATAAQIASHVTSMLTWVGANSSAVPSNHALLYAWNEFDEGGWVCPTWTASGPDHSRLDALSTVLQ